MPCEHEKPIDHFGNRKSGPGGKDTFCKDCRNTQVRRRRKGTGNGGEQPSSHGCATYVEIAKVFGVSKARIQQIEAAALKKLRKRLTLLFRRDLNRLGADDLARLLFR